MTTVKSEGKCAFCGKLSGKAAISRHLNKHLDEFALKNAGSGVSYHIRVENSKRWGGGPWFLNLLMDGRQKFGDLDGFLRDIWLECCGHMSGFQIVGAKPERGGGLMRGLALMMENENAIPGALSMRDDLKSRLRPGMELDYTYDYGSSTELRLRVLAEFPMSTKEGINLLSRNEPFEDKCERCGKNAVSMIDDYSGGEPQLLCKSCAKARSKKGDEVSITPIVNSPRCGVCAYEGGSIDKRRDVFTPGK